MSMIQAMFEIDNTPSRVDRLGMRFMDDPNDLDADEVLELFADTFGLEEDVVERYMDGVVFVPEKKS